MSEQRNTRRTLQGVVVAAKAKDTITVEVERTYKHARYGKYLRRKKKYMVHDPKGEAREGDVVEAIATRPISKHKRWRLGSIVERGDLEGSTLSPDKELEQAATDEGGAS